MCEAKKLYSKRRMGEDLKLHAHNHTKSRRARALRSWMPITIVFLFLPALLVSSLNVSPRTISTSRTVWTSSMPRGTLRSLLPSMALLCQGMLQPSCIGDWIICQSSLPSATEDTIQLDEEADGDGRVFQNWSDKTRLSQSRDAGAKRNTSVNSQNRLDDGTEVVKETESEIERKAKNEVLEAVTVVAETAKWVDSIDRKASEQWRSSEQYQRVQNLLKKYRKIKLERGESESATPGQKISSVGVQFNKQTDCAPAPYDGNAQDRASDDGDTRADREVPIGAFLVSALDSITATVTRPRQTIANLSHSGRRLISQQLTCIGNAAKRHIPIHPKLADMFSTPAGALVVSLVNSTRLSAHIVVSVVASGAEFAIVHGKEAANFAHVIKESGILVVAAAAKWATDVARSVGRAVGEMQFIINLSLIASVLAIGVGHLSHELLSNTPAGVLLSRRPSSENMRSEKTKEHEQKTQQQSSSSAAAAAPPPPSSSKPAAPWSSWLDASKMSSTEKAHQDGSMQVKDPTSGVPWSWVFGGGSSAVGTNEETISERARARALREARREEERRERQAKFESEMRERERKREAQRERKMQERKRIKQTDKIGSEPRSAMKLGGFRPFLGYVSGIGSHGVVKMSAQAATNPKCDTKRGVMTGGELEVGLGHSGVDLRPEVTSSDDLGVQLKIKNDASNDESVKGLEGGSQDDDALRALKDVLDQERSDLESMSGHPDQSDLLRLYVWGLRHWSTRRAWFFAKMLFLNALYFGT